MHFDPHSIKKLEPRRRSRHFEPSIMVFNEIRQFPNVNFFTVSRSKRRSETSLRYDAVPCDYPPNPDPVEAINSGVSCLAYHSVLLGFLFTSPPIGLSTFLVKLPLQAVPFKHVSTVNALADPKPIEPLIITPDIAIGDFEESRSTPSKSSHDSGKHHFLWG
jgi:hypothetical protein